jgi:hypothetical protein
MPKHPKKRVPDATPLALTGWNQIAAFSGEPTSEMQRWCVGGNAVRRQENSRLVSYCGKTLRIHNRLSKHLCGD